MKRYLPGRAHVGYSGFTNYLGEPPTPEEVWKDFPDAIIVDGDDDWNAKRCARPERLCQDMELDVLAVFHTGISGLSHTGFVCTPEVYGKFLVTYQQTYGCHPSVHLRIYKPPVEGGAR